MPGRRERARLGLAVAHDAGDRQAWVVEGRTEGVRQGIAEFPALVDRAGQFGRGVARDAAWERELPEQSAHPLRVARHVRIDLAVGALQVLVGHEPWRAVPGPPDRDHVEVALADDPVQVGIDEVEAGRRAPVPEEPRLDVLGLERLAQQRVPHEVDLPDRQVIRGAPVGVDALEAVRSERPGHERRCASVAPTTAFVALPRSKRRVHVGLPAELVSASTVPADGAGGVEVDQGALGARRQDGSRQNGRSER